MYVWKKVLSFEKGVEIHEATKELRERNRFLFFVRCNRWEISFSKEEATTCCWGPIHREKSRCCKIEWALLNIITVGDFHGWTSRNMLRNIHCSGIDLAQWRQEAGRRWLHPFWRKPSRIVTIFSSMINLRGRSSYRVPAFSNLFAFLSISAGTLKKNQSIN